MYNKLFPRSSQINYIRDTLNQSFNGMSQHRRLTKIKYFNMNNGLEKNIELMITIEDDSKESKGNPIT